MSRFGGISVAQAIAGLLALAALWLVAAPPPPEISGLEASQARILGIVLATLGFWGSGVLPNYLASLIFFAAVLTLGLAPASLVFSGFASTAVWLIVSGFVIGAAISISGLGARLAGLVGPLLAPSYPRLIGGLMLICMIMGFLMPSSVGRAAVLVPIGMALADRAGFAAGSSGRIGVAVILAIGCNMPSFAILPSNIPNMVLSGAAETIHGVRFGYMEYLLLHYPVLGLLKSLATVWLVLRLFPAQVAAPAEAAALPDGRLSAVQIRVLGVLLATLALWATDSLHGVNAAWIGLIAAILLLLPGFGVVSPAAFKTAVDFPMLIFVAGALALGAAVDASGLGAKFGALLGGFLPLAEGRDLLNFLSLSLMSLLTGLFATTPGGPAVLTPLAQDLASFSGFSLEAVLMTQVVGFSTVLFPYQVAPLVVAMQLSGERLSALPRALLPLAAFTILVLLPLDWLWWRLLGWI